MKGEYGQERPKQRLDMNTYDLEFVIAQNHRFLMIAQNAAEKIAREQNGLLAIQKYALCGDALIQRAITNSHDTMVGMYQELSAILDDWNTMAADVTAACGREAL